MNTNSHFVISPVSDPGVNRPVRYGAQKFLSRPTQEHTVLRGHGIAGGHVALQLGGGHKAAATVFLNPQLAGLNSLIECGPAQAQNARRLDQIKSHLGEMLGIEGHRRLHVV